jgi:hypothetical protein
MCSGAAIIDAIDGLSAKNIIIVDADIAVN